MRKMLMTCAAVVGLAATASAQTATPATGTPGGQQPASSRASNITPTDTHSTIAPSLPAPGGGQNASITQFLTDAQTALTHRQTGRAQEALERAETAMLQRAVPADQATTPDQAPDVKQVEAARDDLAHHDVNGAKQAIQAAMTSAPQQ